ncbi:MAG: putative heme d1 biosynthesis radical SAM protein NirJ2 [Thermodesulfovibrionales bacterium]
MAASEHKPYIVSWNLTGRCNLSCPHCYLDAGGRLPGELSGEEARLVIDELSYLNSRLMLVLSGGEPMLREDIFEIVESASQAGFITVMGTNGTLLAGGDLRRLKDAGLRGVGISVDSAGPSYHDSFRGAPGAWGLSTGALAAARDAGLETQMDVTLTDGNWQEVDGLVELGAALGVKAVNFFFLVCTGRAEKTDISSENYGRALSRIARLFMDEKRLMARARCAPHIYRVLHEEGFSIPQGARGCLAGRAYMRIDPEGNVTPCPYMGLSAGNVKERSLSTIWEESPVFGLLREGSYGGRCGACEYSAVCGGCRARALAEKGDVMEEDSLCDYRPRGGGEVETREEFEPGLRWEDGAVEKVRRVPPFMKRMVIRVIEAKARERGVEVITSAFVDEIKSRGYSDLHGKNGR